MVFEAAVLPGVFSASFYDSAPSAGLGFNPLNPNQLTDESILAIEEGIVNKDGKKVFAPRPSGVDMIQQIKNSVQQLSQHDTPNNA